MVRTFALIAVLCTPLPALAQSRVYTNADLAAGPVTFAAAVSPDEAVRVLKASRSLLDRTDAGTFAIDAFGPRVTILPWSGDRPGFLPDNNAVVMAGSGSYADQLWSDPVSAYALQHPIEAAYGYRHSYGATFSTAPRGHVPSSTGSMVVAPTTPTSAPRTVTNGSGMVSGHRVR